MIRNEEPLIRGQGSNSSSLRFHNEKTILHLLRYLRTASRADLVYHTSLTSQAVAVITSNLEKKNLITQVGKKISGVGQPSFLYRLNPDGAFSVGFNIGRKTLDMILVNFDGKIYRQDSHEYFYPQVNTVIREIKNFMNCCWKILTEEQKPYFKGIGISMPYHLDLWQNELEIRRESVEQWDQKVFKETISNLFSFPIYFENDMNAATISALVLGKGNQFRNFLYIYQGTFIGGGLVFDGKLFRGPTDHAGNIGTFPIVIPANCRIIDKTKTETKIQLLSIASFNRLKQFLVQKGLTIAPKHKDFLQQLNCDDPKFQKWLSIWIEESSQLLAQVILGATSIFDFEVVIIDGSSPYEYIKKFCQTTQIHFKQFDTTGLNLPKIIQGELGIQARPLGSALIPFYERYVPSNVLIKNHKINSLRMNGLQAKNNL